MAGVREDGTASYFEPTLMCHAGAAKLDITPPVGIYTRMWGAALHDCATAVHRPLYASALVLAEDESAPRVLITLDVCVMAFEETQVRPQPHAPFRPTPPHPTHLTAVAHLLPGHTC